MLVASFRRRRSGISSDTDMQLRHREFLPPSFLELTRSRFGQFAVAALRLAAEG